MVRDDGTPGSIVGVRKWFEPPSVRELTAFFVTAVALFVVLLEERRHTFIEAATGDLIVRTSYFGVTTSVDRTRTILGPDPARGRDPTMHVRFEGFFHVGISDNEPACALRMVATELRELADAEDWSAERRSKMSDRVWSAYRAEAANRRDGEPLRGLRPEYREWAGY